MSWTQTIVGSALVIVLLVVSGYFSWRQLLALRRLRSRQLPDLEHRYERNQAWRRLVGCALLLVLAVLLTFALVALEAPAQKLADQKIADAKEITPEQAQFRKLYGWFWLTFLVVLMIVVFLAGVDLWATRRWGLRQQHKLLADRRAMLQRQVARLRREHQGRD